MNIKQAIENYLVSHNGLAALIGSDFYWREFPQEFSGKGLLGNKISAPRETAVVDPGIVYGRFQFTAMGVTEKEPDDILEQVRNALQDFTGIMGTNGEDIGVQVDYTELANEIEIPTSDLPGIFMDAAEWLIYYHE